MKASKKDLTAGRFFLPKNTARTSGAVDPRGDSQPEAVCHHPDVSIGPKDERGAVHVVCVGEDCGHNWWVIPQPKGAL
jgi:hypothetical protein